jgi:hypothetical protein
MYQLLNPVLETTISLTFIYALLSILSSILIEWWNHYRKSRGKLLHSAIIQMLNDPQNLSYGELLMNHFLIKNLINPHTGRPPQYISANLFAEALIDIIAQQSRHTLKLTLPRADDTEAKIEIAPGQNLESKTKKLQDRFKEGLELMKPSSLRDTLFSFYDKSGDGEYPKLKEALADWYNDYMDRVSGWYKTQLINTNIVFGFIIAIGLNVDSIHLFRVLSMNADLRQELTAVAEATAKNYQTLADSNKQNVAELRALLLKTRLNDTLSVSTKDSTLVHQQLLQADTLAKANLIKADSVLWLAASLNVPIGWDLHQAPLSWFFGKHQAGHPTNHSGLLAYQERRNYSPSFLYFLGIVISAYALSFGAPFWFELLAKLVNIRKAGGKPKGEVA